MYKRAFATILGSYAVSLLFVLLTLLLLSSAHAGYIPTEIGGPQRYGSGGETLPVVKSFLIGDGYPVAVTVRGGWGLETTLDADAWAPGVTTRVDIHNGTAIRHSFAWYSTQNFDAGDSLYVALDATGSGQTHGSIYASVLSVVDGAPENFTASIGGDGVDMVWDPEATAASYQVWRRLPGEWYAPITEIPVKWTGTIDQLPTVCDSMTADGCAFYDTGADVFRWVGIQVETLVGGWAAGQSVSLCNVSSSRLETWDRHTEIRNTDLAGSDLLVDGYPVYHVWAPHVVLSGGYYWMAWTGVDRATYADPGELLCSSGLKIERIFLSRAPVSADLDDPTVWRDSQFILDGSMVSYVAGDGWSEPTGWEPGTAWAAQCRDPHLVYSEDDETWAMTVTLNTADGSQAVGVATADEITGPWALRGYVTATKGSKAESSFLLYSEVEEGWLLFVRHLTAYSVYSSPTLLGEYTDTGRYITNKIYDPLELPETADHFVRPNRSDAEAWLFLWATEQPQIGVGAVGVWEDSTVTRITPALSTVTPVGALTDTSLTDTSLEAGVEVDYGVASVISTGAASGLAAMQSIETEDRTMIKSFSAIYVPGLPNRTRAALVTDLDFVEYSYRIAVAISEDSVGTADLDTATFGEWVPVDAWDGSIFISHVEDLADGEYCHLRVQTKASTSSEAYDDQADASAGYVQPAEVIDVLSAEQDGSSLVVTWEEATHPNFQYYKLGRIYSGTGETVWFTPLASESYTDTELVGDGLYIYYARTVCTVNGVDEESTNGTAGLVTYTAPEPAGPDTTGPVLAAADSSYNDTLDRAIAELTSDEPCTLTYRVRENQDAYGTPVVGDTLNTSFELQHDASGLSEGDVVTFQMAGADTIGNVSADSLEITVTVPSSGGGGATTAHIYHDGSTAFSVTGTVVTFGDTTYTVDAVEYHDDLWTGRMYEAFPDSTGPTNWLGPIIRGDDAFPMLASGGTDALSWFGTDSVATHIGSGTVLSAAALLTNSTSIIESSDDFYVVLPDGDTSIGEALLGGYDFRTTLNSADINTSTAWSSPITGLTAAQFGPYRVYNRTWTGTETVRYDFTAEAASGGWSGIILMAVDDTSGSGDELLMYGSRYSTTSRRPVIILIVED